MQEYEKFILIFPSSVVTSKEKCWRYKVIYRQGHLDIGRPMINHTRVMACLFFTPDTSMQIFLFSMLNEKKENTYCYIDLTLVKYE